MLETNIKIMKNAFVCFKHVVSVDWVRMGLTLKTNNNN